MIKFKKFIPAVMVSVLALSSAHADPTKQSKNPVVADLGSQKIYYTDVVNRKNSIPQLAAAPMDNMLYLGLLQEMAAEALIKEEVGKSTIENTAEYKERVEKCKEGAKLQVFLEKKVEKLVTDEKLMEVFNKVKKEFKEQDEVSAAHILVDKESEAKAILAELKSGKNFDDLVQKKSKDSTSKSRGGKLGYFTKDMAKATLGPEFAESVFLLKPGSNYTVTKSKFGWHVVKVSDKRKSKPPKFEQVAPQLRMLQSQKSLLEYMQKLMKDNNVKLFDLNGKEIDWQKANDSAAGAQEA